MSYSEMRNRLRALLEGDTCHFTGQIADPISARAASSLGFSCAMMPGSVVSLAVVGAPDITLVTLTELAEQVRRVARAISIPFMVDADHGFGNALNVARTIEELEMAGASGVTIEDTLLPQPFGDAGKALLIPLQEAVGKMRAAVDSRRDPTTVVMARGPASRRMACWMTCWNG